MLSFEEMLFRLIIAVILGAIIGLERELVGKDAGIRTGIIVASGAYIFSLIALSIPYLLPLNPEEVSKMLTSGNFLGIMANIVVGIGFLGAGIIIKTEGHTRGLTTAAIVWFIAAIGVAVGVGLIKFACITTAIIVVILYLFRNIDIQGNPQK